MHHLNPASSISKVPRTVPWLRYLIPVLLLVVVAGGAVYVFKPELLGFSSPEETIFKFVKAYNEKDINVMLTCFDSRIERGFKGVGDMVGKLIGVNPSDLFEIIPILAGVIGNQPGNSQLENVTIVQRSASGASASVVAMMNEHMTLEKGKRISNLKIRFELKREGSNWRIFNMQAIQ